MRRKSWFALGTVLLTLFIGTTVYATTAVALSNRALAENATVIATGHCTGIRTVWEGRVLVTLATIAVTDVIKGEPGETLTVALPGGIDANRKFPISMVYPGAPQIGIGEDVFVFLGPEEGIATGLTVVGFSQGKFSIIDDEEGQKVVSRNLSTIMLQTPGGTRRGTATKVRLNEFKTEIRGYLR